MMPIIKRIVCFANSRKLQGRCVAGREYNGTENVWIRPVSNREHEEVSEYERQYDDGSDPRLLDIIDVPLLLQHPNAFQSENWLLDPEHYWAKAGRLKWTEIHRFVDPISPLWNNNHSSWNGINDRITFAEAVASQSSLRLIEVRDFSLTIFKPGEAFGDHKRRVQASFRYGGTQYALWVTDPKFERAYLSKDDGTYEIGEAFLTISLGEPYKEYCYKLVAAILTPTTIEP